MATNLLPFQVTFTVAPDKNKNAHTALDMNICLSVFLIVFLCLLLPAVQADRLTRGTNYLGLSLSSRGQ